jgi:hypothetical protein
MLPIPTRLMPKFPPVSGKSVDDPRMSVSIGIVSLFFSSLSFFLCSSSTFVVVSSTIAFASTSAHMVYSCLFYLASSSFFFLCLSFFFFVLQSLWLLFLLQLLSIVVFQPPLLSFSYSLMIQQLLLIFFSFLLQMLLLWILSLLLLLLLPLLQLPSSLFIFYCSQWVMSPFENNIVVCSGLEVDFFLLPDINFLIPFVLAIFAVVVDNVQRIVPLKSFLIEVKKC